MERTEEDLIYSYAAGVLDGDGAIYFSKEKEGSRIAHIPFIQLVKKYGTLILSFKSNFGGMVGPVKQMKPHHSPLYYWRLKGVKNCDNFIKKVSQFLIYKKERAELLIEYIDKNPFARGMILTPEQIADREKYYVKLAALNAQAFVQDIVMVGKSSVNSQDPAFWSYIAGIMDTDGSFSIKRQKGHSETINLRYLPQIQMSMASLDVINHIRNNCTFGTVCEPKNKSCTRGFHYAWSIGKKSDCIEFIEKILPFLREKNEQAELVSEFCKNSQNTKYCKVGIPEKELEYRESCYQRMIKLNKRKTNLNLKLD